MCKESTGKKSIGKKKKQNISLCLWYQPCGPMSNSAQTEGHFAFWVTGSKARFLIDIQVQHVITEEHERVDGQILKHLTVRLLSDLYIHSFQSCTCKFGKHEVKWFLAILIHILNVLIDHFI